MSWFLGLVSALIVIIVIGFIIERRYIKQSINALHERIKKIPAIGTLYGAIQQMIGLFVKNDDSKMKSMKPVYCRFGGTIVLALMPTADKFIINDKVYYSVIIPVQNNIIQPVKKEA